MQKLSIASKSVCLMAMVFLLPGLCPHMVHASDVMTSEDPYTGQVLKVRVDGNQGP